MQNVIVISVIAAAVIFLAWKGWRALSPRKGGCGGNCGCGNEKNVAMKTAENGGKTVFIASGDLINRVRARKG
jgi:hypothetical protein